MSKAAHIELLIIDPQMDFLDTPNNQGSLAVTGGYDDMGRLTNFIKRVGPRLADIHVTLDSHHHLDVAHAAMWRSPTTGKHPSPFTVISSKDVGMDKAWVPVVPSLTAQFQKYTEALEKGGRYPLLIWPDHCLIGTPGQAVHGELYEQLKIWEEMSPGIVDKITKGSNPYTEHYSAVQAEVPDPSDPGTLPNTRLMDTLAQSDQILIAGEALSHCVANTVRDIVKYFGVDNAKKMVLLIDCTSNVGGFENMGDTFLQDFKSWGGQIVKSTDYMV